MSTYILGVSASIITNSAACLIRDGNIIAAAQEERFTRKRFDDRERFAYKPEDFPNASTVYGQIVSRLQ